MTKTETKAPKAPKAPKAENVIEARVDGVRTVKLGGREGNRLQVSINGVPAELPCGTFFEVSEDLYNAISAHIIDER